MKKWVLRIAAVLLCVVLCAPLTVSQAAETVYDSSEDCYVWKYAASVSEFTDAVDDLAMSVPDSFTVMFSSRSVYDRVTGNSELMLQALQNAGVFSYGWSGNSSKLSVHFSNIVYYPGKRMGVAWDCGDESNLTAREKKTLKAAKKLVKSFRAKNKTSLAMEKAIHDYLISNVKYDSTKYDDNKLHERDTAVGALLNGKADCDGYADAFYLLCYISGFVDNIRYMRVSDRTQKGYHMLNQIRLDDDKWYLVDVTWDDPDYRKLRLYRCFNIGTNIASYYYDWERDLFSGLVAKPGDKYVKVAYYYTNENSALAGLSAVKKYVNKRYKEGYRNLVFAIKDTSLKARKISSQFSRKHYYWSWKRDGYLWFEIYFY